MACAHKPEFKNKLVPNFSGVSSYTYYLRFSTIQLGSYKENAGGGLKQSKSSRSVCAWPVYTSNQKDRDKEKLSKGKLRKESALCALADKLPKWH